MKTMIVLFVLATLSCSAIRLRLDKTNVPVSCLKHDGFGAQYQCQLAAIAVARHKGQCYMHTNFDTDGFHKVTDTTVATFDAEKFTGLKSDTGPNCTGDSKDIKTPLAAECGMGPEGGCADQYYTKEVRREMRSMYDSTPKPPTDHSCEVAFHVRRGDVQGGGRWTSNTVIEDVITSTFSNKTVCIYSEGKDSDFGTLQALDNVKFKLNGDVGTAFHGLVAAPELVIASSSFSYTAAMLNSGQVYYVKRFWHHMLADWKQVTTRTSPQFYSKTSETLMEPPTSNKASAYKDFD